MKKYLILFLFAMHVLKPEIAISKTTPSITVENTQLEVMFGVPLKTNIRANIESGEPITWSVSKEVLPPGLELKQEQSNGNNNNEVEIIGTPEFAGSWCFELSAKAGSEIAKEWICYFSENNFSLNHPKLGLEKSSVSVFVGSNLEITLVFDTSDSDISNIQLGGDIIPGVSTSAFISKGIVALSGIPQELGKYSITITATNRAGMRASFQSLIGVFIHPEPVPTPALPPLKPTPRPEPDPEPIVVPIPTPVPSTPVPSTPVPSTPVPSTPVPSTPVPSTPVPEPANPSPLPHTPTQPPQPPGGSHGGRIPGYCKALYYVGNTAESAVAACVNAGHSYILCTDNLKCEIGSNSPGPRNTSYCKSLYYVGNTAESAVAACVNAGYSNIVCTDNLKCGIRN